MYKLLYYVQIKFKSSYKVLTSYLAKIKYFDIFELFENKVVHPVRSLIYYSIGGTNNNTI